MLQQNAPGRLTHLLTTLGLCLMASSCLRMNDKDVEEGRDPDGDGVLWPEDCDNTDDQVGGEEIPYDGQDNDCDAETLDDDLDGDGLIASGDCDDQDPDAGAPSPEQCDGVDNDCDGLTDDEDTQVIDSYTWYADWDQDGAGDPNNTLESCDVPDGYEAASGDCDDTDAELHPGAYEVCNDGLDQNCDRKADGNGEACLGLVHCTQGEACEGRSCVCDCDEDSFVGWELLYYCNSMDACPFTRSPFRWLASADGVDQEVSCPDELLAIGGDTANVIVVAELDCASVGMDTVLEWYSYTLRGSAKANSGSIIAFDVDGQTEVFRLNLYEVTLQSVVADDLDLDARSCTGVATVTLMVELAEFA